MEDTSPQLGGNLDLNGFTVGDATAADLTKLSALTATATELNHVDGVTSAIQTQLGGKQPLDSDLTAIAALSPSNDDIVQRKAGAWTNRTMAQLIADLAALGTTFQPLDELLTEIAALSTAPGADRGLFYDHSSTAMDFFTATNGVEFSTTNLQMTSNQRQAEIVFVIDGYGSVLTTGVKGYLQVPFACTITRCTMLPDQSGSVVVDIWKDTYANYPPVNADSITASANPTISAATKSEDATLTGWTTSIAAGDILGFNVDSCSSITRLTVTLRVTKT